MLPDCQPNYYSYHYLISSYWCICTLYGLIGVLEAGSLAAACQVERAEQRAVAPGSVLLRPVAEAVAGLVAPACAFQVQPRSGPLARSLAVLQRAQQQLLPAVASPQVVAACRRIVASP
jgi:hypothetical protein